MKNRTRLWQIAWVFALALTLPAIAQDHRGHIAKASTQFSADMHAGMDKMMVDMASAPMSGNPDTDFLAMMIPHHEGAVEMARLVLIHGRDPLTRQLAEEIIAGQQVEIAAMRARLKILATNPGAASEAYPALGGTRGVSATKK